MRDVGRPRADLWEVGVWSDMLDVKNTEAFSIYQVHNEAIGVHETVDAARALTGIEKDGKGSIEKADRTLGIKKKFYRI